MGNWGSKESPEPPAEPPQPVPSKPAAEPPKPVPAKPAAEPPKPVPAKPPAEPPQPVPAKPAAEPPKPVPAKPPAEAPQPVPAKPPAEPPQPVPAKPAAEPPKPAPAKPAAESPQPAAKSPQPVPAKATAESPQPAAKSPQPVPAKAAAESPQPVPAGLRPQPVSPWQLLPKIKFNIRVRPDGVEVIVGLEYPKTADEPEHPKTSLLMVVVAYSASSSEACEERMEPIFNKLVDKKYPGVTYAKMDVDEMPDAAQHFGIQTTPTFVLIEDVKEVDKVVGADLKELRRKIETHKFRLQLER